MSLKILENDTKKAKGFTLTELIIASFMALIITTIMITVFLYGRKAYDYASHSYFITRETYSAIEWIKKDLSQTSLNTIRVYHDKKDNNEYVGVSMETAVDSKKESFVFDEDGTAKWTGHIFYLVIPDAEKEIEGKKIKIGKLMRWEKPLDDENNIPYPMATDILPWEKKYIGKNANLRCVANEVIMPGQDLTDSKKKKIPGFRVTFVRIDPVSGEEILSDINPSLVSDKESDSSNNSKSLTPAGNTELVNVEMSVFQVSRETNQTNAFDISFRVKPKN